MNILKTVRFFAALFISSLLILNINVLSTNNLVFKSQQSVLAENFYEKTILETKAQVIKRMKDNYIMTPANPYLAYWNFFDFVRTQIDAVTIHIVARTFLIYLSPCFSNVASEISKNKQKIIAYSDYREDFASKRCQEFRKKENLTKQADFNRFIWKFYANLALVGYLAETIFFGTENNSWSISNAGNDNYQEYSKWMNKLFGKTNKSAQKNKFIQKQIQELSEMLLFKRKIFRLMASTLQILGKIEAETIETIFSTTKLPPSIKPKYEWINKLSTAIHEAGHALLIYLDPCLSNNTTDIIGEETIAGSSGYDKVKCQLSKQE